MANITGTPGDDSGAAINGTNQADVIESLGGNDRIFALFGDDSIDGGTGNDSIFADRGNDTLNGGDDNDRLFGMDGDDLMIGGAGADLLHGGQGSDTADYSGEGTRIFLSLKNPNINADAAAGDTFFSIENVTGTMFNDQVAGDDNANVLTMGAGDDIAYGFDDNDTINGDNGDDRLFGMDGDDSLSGGADNDTLTGGDGADAHDGGDGILDFASYRDDHSGITLDLANGANSTGHAAGDTYVDVEGFWMGGGDDTVVGSSDSEFVIAGSGQDSVDGGGGADILLGEGGGDTLNGDGGNDSINGGTGNDSINGGADDDQLTGGTGRDTLTGGEGADTFVIENSGNNMVTITDFSASEGDLINVEDFGPVSPAWAEANVQVFDFGEEGMLFRIGFGQTVFFEDASDLDINNVVFIPDESLLV